MQRTGDTIAPSAFNSFIALSTSLRSKPESSAILPAFNGSPACFIVANTFSFASIMMSVLSVIIRYVQAANTRPARIAYSKLVIIPQITSNRHNVYFVGGGHSPHRERRPVRTHFLGEYVGDPGLRFAHPGLNPVGIRLRGHVLNGRSLRRDYRNIYSAMPRRPYTTQNEQCGASVNGIRNGAARRRPDRTRAERQRGCSRG